jgi:CMP-N,N'-diacetyllegionaminic acid synthase
MLEKKKLKILCTICARGGSTGIKNKNLLKIGNKSLVQHSISHAIKTKFIDRVVLTSDSNNVIKSSKNLDLDFAIKRSKKIATNRAPKIYAIRDAVKKMEKIYKEKYDFIIDLDVTSPLRTQKDLKLAIKKIIKEKSDILLSVIPSRKNPYFNMIEKKKKKFILVKKRKFPFFSRQACPKVFDLNGSIYIWSRKFLFKTDNIWKGKVSIHLMENKNALDIDEFDDFLFVKYLFEKNKCKKF